MNITFWGVRGSIPTPGPECTGVGGNTPCVQVGCDDGTRVILDAGSGIRGLGTALEPGGGPLHILLTHLHLDHIQGLLFFAPFFDDEAEITVWGPPGGGRTLRERLARYLSSPLSPVEIRELPAQVSFRDVPPDPWRLGDCELSAALVAHRGPTLGYRIEAGGCALCYLPDHEPGLGVDMSATPGEWISGFGLAQDADLLIHDCQYFDDEYREHVGWGHSRLADVHEFAVHAGAERTLLFHHDPGHDDAALDGMSREATQLWSANGNGGEVAVACEGDELRLASS